MKLNFSILLVIHKRNTFTQFFQMGVVRQVWAWSECCQMVSQLHIKNELSYEVDKYIGGCVIFSNIMVVLFHPLKLVRSFYLKCLISINQMKI